MKKTVYVILFLLDGLLFVHLLSPDQAVRAEMQPVERGIAIETDVVHDIPPPDGNVSFPALPSAVPSPRVVTIPPFESVRSPEWREFTATAYCLRGITRTGTRTRPGTLAVDPALIPFGSILEVSAGPYSGIYYALDSGGLVKGAKVDIYIKTHREAIQFGRRKVLLRLLRAGWGEDTPASLERDALAVRSAELRP